MMNNISEDKQSKSIGLGLVVGIAFGAATDNIGLGIAMGLAFGAGIDTAKKIPHREKLINKYRRAGSSVGRAVAF